MFERSHLPRRIEAFPLRDDGWHDVFHVLFWLAMIGLIALLAVWLITSMRRDAQRATMEPASATWAPGRTPPDAALEEARMRYARGEIAREDYRRMIVDLGGSAPPPEEPSPVPQTEDPGA